MNEHYSPGDLVEVLPAEDIISTLDSDGTLDGLPFMPEMLKHCGARYRVSQRVVQAAIDDETQSLREFKIEDVVMLEKLRCSGSDHDDCQRGCMLFWRQAWLRRVDQDAVPLQPLSSDMDALRSRLKTKADSETYFCQSTEFHKVTARIARWRRLGKCVSAVRAGNYSLGEMIKALSVWGWWKGRQKLLGVYPRGDCRKTPVDILDLQSGEMVAVKTLAEIVPTLDKHGKNRGLHFSPDMLPFCGNQYRVKARTGKMISELSGRMYSLPHTVILEDVLCDSATYAFGGCPRSDFQYWREIWLKRVA